MTALHVSGEREASLSRLHPAAVPAMEPFYNQKSITTKLWGVCNFTHFLGNGVLERTLPP
jgi:hypothetical protein